MTVYLVGAGPGDPGLLTVRAADVLRHAEVVVYDRLSVAALLDLAPPGAERVAVGKTPGRQGVSQEEINTLLVERGQAGQEVVRLKGGDPFVFARGGEEAAALLAAGVRFEVVPGITSAVAVPAYAGIPLTRRGLATSFTVVTGHEDPWAATETDWEAVARVGGTIVVLMGVATRGAIAARLLAGGLPGDTPVAAVTWGTRPEQRTVRTTLAGLGAAAVEAPATIVIGAVAALDLGWFEHRPLFGRSVVVTREDPGGRLAGALGALGAEVVAAPVIAIADPADGGAALRSAAAEARLHDWVVFTSANAVARFAAHLPDLRALGAARVAVVGPATAAALAAVRIQADLVARPHTAAALVEQFPTGPGSVLVPQAAGARPTVAAGLRERGWEVRTVVAYETRAVAPSPEALVAAKAADAITFLSGSAVDAWPLEVVPPVVVCIGPVTAAATRARGFAVTAVAEPHTVDGVVAAVADVLGAPEGSAPDRP